MFGLNWKNIGNFHPLEVVGRSSETQLQVKLWVAVARHNFKWMEIKII